MTKNQKFKKRKERERRVRKEVLARRARLRKEAAAAKYLWKLENAARKGDAKAKAELEAIEVTKKMMQEGGKKDDIFETANVGFAPSPPEKTSPQLQVVLDKLEERKKTSGPSWD